MAQMWVLVTRPCDIICTIRGSIRIASFVFGRLDIQSVYDTT